MEAIVFQLHIEPVPDEVIAARIVNAEFFLQNLAVSLIFRSGLGDCLCHLLPFLSALLEFPRQFYSDLVRLAICCNDLIDDIGHLVENLFHHRIP